MVISVREMRKMQAFNIQKGQHHITCMFIYLEANFTCDVKSTQEAHSGIWQYVYFITLRYF